MKLPLLLRFATSAPTLPPSPTTSFRPLPYSGIHLNLSPIFPLGSTPKTPPNTHYSPPSNLDRHFATVPAHYFPVPALPPAKSSPARRPSSTTTPSTLTAAALRTPLDPSYATPSPSADPNVSRGFAAAPAKSSQPASASDGTPDSSLPVSPH